MINPLALIADAHLDYRQYGMKEREEDFKKAFVNAVETSMKLGVYHMAVAGDFLNSKRPSSRIMDWLLDQQEYFLEKGMLVDIMDGNHDDCKPSWIELLARYHTKSTKVGERVAGFYSVNNDQLIVGDEGSPQYKVCFCPHFDAEAVLKWCEEIPACEVVLLHLPVQQFIGYPSTTALDLEKMPKDKFKYVIVGDTHVNKEITIGETIYISPGSTEMNDASEQADKYVYFVYRNESGEMKHRKEPLKIRPVVEIAIENESDLEAALLKLQDVQDQNPIIKGYYLGDVPDALKRIKTVIDQDKVINRMECKVMKPSQNYEGEKKSNKKLCDYVGDHIPNKECEEYKLAYTLAGNVEDAANKIDTYIENRKEALKSA
jgi:DNA repair exonuclease SbcCD nuclease subunit